jgi:UDP-glucose 4-epimerase
MSILVTGGAGYIGSHAVHELVDRGETVIVIDDLSTGFKWAVPEGARLVIGDAGNEALLSRIFTENRIETVIHFAASTVVPESVRNPLRYYRNNTSNARTLIESAADHGVAAFIFSSTAAVYGPCGSEPVPETHPCQPISPYGASKRMVEQMLADAEAAGGPRFMILRYFNVAGADPKLRTGQSTRNASHLIKVAAQAITGGYRTLQVFGDDYATPDGTCVRDYIHVSDLVDAHIAAMEALRAGAPSNLFNCGYGRGYSVLEVIRAMEAASHVRLMVTRSPRRPGDPPSIIADTAKIRGALGWRPRLDDLETICRHALLWEERLAQQQAA